MARQTLFVKAFNVLNSNRLLVFNKMIQPPIVGLKHDTRQMVANLNIPERPKKPLLPFMRFAQVTRPKLYEEYPDLKLTDAMKKCAELWKNVDKATKENYSIEYKRELEVYTHKYLEYGASLSDEQKDALSVLKKEKTKDKQMRQVRKLKKDTNKPKRPNLPYVRYMLEQAKALDTNNMFKLPQEIRDSWRRMNDSEKEKYTNAYKEEKVRYEIALKQWEMKMLDEGHESLVSSKTIAEQRPTRLLKEQRKKHE